MGFLFFNSTYSKETFEFLIISYMKNTSTLGVKDKMLETEQDY